MMLSQEAIILAMSQAGNRIAHLMVDRNMSNKMLSIASGVSEDIIRQLLQRTRSSEGHIENIKIGTLLRICDALQVPLEAIIDANDYQQNGEEE